MGIISKIIEREIQRQVDERVEAESTRRFFVDRVDRVENQYYELQCRMDMLESKMELFPDERPMRGAAPYTQTPVKQ